MSEGKPLTDLLRQAAAGDAAALRTIFHETYEDLRKIARGRLGRGGRSTRLDTTALVHESFMRFVGTRRLQLQDRQQFFRYAAQVMRSVVVDVVRERQAARRGGGLVRVTLDDQFDDRTDTEKEIEVLGVHSALEELRAMEPRLAQVVELRYFGGLEETEIAEALDIAVRTVRRDWSKARLMLATILENRDVP